MLDQSKSHNKAYPTQQHINLGKRNSMTKSVSNLEVHSIPQHVALGTETSLVSFHRSANVCAYSQPVLKPQLNLPPSIAVKPGWSKWGGGSRVPQSRCLPQSSIE